MAAVCGLTTVAGKSRARKSWIEWGADVPQAQKSREMVWIAVV